MSFRWFGGTTATKDGFRWFGFGSGDEEFRQDHRIDHADTTEIIESLNASEGERTCLLPFEDEDDPELYPVGTRVKFMCGDEAGQLGIIKEAVPGNALPYRITGDQGGLTSCGEDAFVPVDNAIKSEATPAEHGDWPKALTRQEAEQLVQLLEKAFGSDGKWGGKLNSVPVIKEHQSANIPELYVGYVAYFIGQELNRSLRRPVKGAPKLPEPPSEGELIEL